MTKVVALTGGIGSGKSTVADYFAAHHVPIIDADKIAHDLCAMNQPALDKIKDAFGGGIFHPDGNLNRAALRTLIFSDPQAKATLEGILHPLIRDEIGNQVKCVNAPYCLVVIPLLAENFKQYADILDHVVVLETPSENQITWASERDHAKKQDIELIAAQQATPEARRQIADTLLENDGTIEDLQKKVEALHQQFLSLK